MIECQLGAHSYLCFERLSQESALAHGVFTRHGGVSQPPYASLNASASTGDDPASVAHNREIIAGALGMPLASLRPVHGATVVEVTAHSPRVGGTARWRSLAEEGDAMITAKPGIGLFWAFADCVPIILYDPVRPAVALVHAGWRGSAGAIALRAVRAMRSRYGSQPGELLAGLAPAIGKCCYRVDDEVRARFRANPDARDTVCYEERDDNDESAGSGGRLTYLDLWETNRRQLLAAGLAPEHIELAGICTGCRTDLFYSHRIEPKPTGRFGVAVGLVGA